MFYAPLFLVMTGFLGSPVSCILIVGYTKLFVDCASKFIQKVCCFVQYIHETFFLNGFFPYLTNST
uniref:Uncharacterized protein n=1 Tax=Anguilla anguilla TaxID=7936 RepID=A0A0E9R4J1_ANGAN